MGFGMISHDIGPIRIVRTELMEDAGISVHPGDSLATPLIVEGNVHQGKAFNDRAIGGEPLQYRGHDAVSRRTSPNYSPIMRLMHKVIAAPSQSIPLRPRLGCVVDAQHFTVLAVVLSR
jgi:hypothetical protein